MRAKRIASAAVLAVAVTFVVDVMLFTGGSVVLAGEAPAAKKTETAIFAGGCFWCMEGPFDKLEGVISTESGYAGGEKKHPTYDDVSRGETGHAESIRVTYDPERVSYGKLLEVFWHNIDPLSANGQFCDRGSQYRSAIFVKNDAERALAAASREKVAERFRGRGKVATEILDATEFYPAEEYHQDFYRKDPARYQSYRKGCGRDQRLAELWGEGGAH